jgi:DNA polymerase elongation subunit (family B)
MKLVNIANEFRKIYLFCRNDKGDLEIQTINNFFPYYYMPDPSGTFMSYKGEPLRKMIVSSPADVAKNRDMNSYEADILFTRRYLIDRVEEIERTTIKYAFIDIEVLSDELPNVQEAKCPVSCISVGNSANQAIKTFYLGDYQSEHDLFTAFLTYMQQEKFDLWLSWNVKFDYNYMYYRFPDFAQKLSPIGKTRYGDGEVYYPAGISIVDYLAWFKKVTFNREKEYSLDYIAQTLLKEQGNEKVEFGKLSDKLVEKNINDVRRMAKIEEKKKLIPYFDEIRRLSKVEWEDLIWNSRVIDMLILQEAQKQKVVLPMRPRDLEKEEFEGAYREAFDTGAFFNIGKYDLSSAYPTAIIDFCLDPANIIENDIATDTTNFLKIENTLFKQNSNTLLPTVVKKLLILKRQIKEVLSTLAIDTEEYENTKKMYDAIKSVVNSAYGVMGNRFFRLYDNRVASATTFIVRDVLKYVKDQAEKDGYKIIYVDTDSVFVDSKEDLTEYLNNLIKTWAKEKYGKNEIHIEFEYEGRFEKLLILTKCRYLGYINKGKGIEEEMKGVEAKRKDSTTFMKTFQKDLINKILNKEPKEAIFTWIKAQLDKVKATPLHQIAFPCKLARKPEEYKNTPIFLRALRNTPGFDKKVGDSFYYIFMEGKDEKKKQLVQAFDEESFNHIDKTKIDWEHMINRNIVMKLVTIFEAMKWDIKDVVEIKEKKKRGRKKKVKDEEETGEEEN